MFWASALCQSNWQSFWWRATTQYVSFFYPLQWPIYVFNSVVNTKLPAILSHQGSTTVSLETYPLCYLSMSQFLVFFFYGRDIQIIWCLEYVSFYKISLDKSLNIWPFCFFLNVLKIVQSLRERPPALSTSSVQVQ